MAESLGAIEAVLDGEIVAFDTTGRPSFAALQKRMHVTTPAQVRRLAQQTPATYLVFDVLHLEGHSLLDEPYAERRRALDALALSGPSWQTTPYFAGNGAAVLAASQQQGLEGVVAKRLDARYLAGKRSDLWLKVKNFRTQSVVIGGWQAGEGRRAQTIGSLLVGIPDGDGLHYVGRVGSGLGDQELSDLAMRLSSLAIDATPFVDETPREVAHWVRPELVAEVTYGEWTPDGRMRHPVWRGLRTDIDASEVERES